MKKPYNGLTAYVLCYNEEVMLPHFIAHYRKMFPGCRIVVYNNESTDDTADIARANNCHVVPYFTGGKLSDRKYLEIKNNCWKNSQTDWVLIADCDELCQITELQLKQEHNRGVSIIKFNGYNMVNHADNLDIGSINKGVRAVSYDKAYLFNRKHITSINYEPGAHHCKPHGYVDYGNNEYVCKHYKYINIDYMIARHALFASRLSEENKKHGFGGHYEYTPEQIRAEFLEAREKSIIIP